MKDRMSFFEFNLKYSGLDNKSISTIKLQIYSETIIHYEHDAPNIAVVLVPSIPQYSPNRSRAQKLVNKTTL